MVQFYFLSVLLNILVGVILIVSNNSTKLNASNFDSEEEGNSFLSDIEHDSILSNETFCVIVGIICTLIGFLKLFFTYSTTKNIILFGDFFPAIFGLGCGLILVLDFYKSSLSNTELPAFIESIFFENKKYFGCCSIIVGFLHFIFPGVLFL